MINGSTEQFVPGNTTVNPNSLLPPPVNVTAAPFRLALANPYTLLGPIPYCALLYPRTVCCAPLANAPITGLVIAAWNWSLRSTSSNLELTFVAASLATSTMTLVPGSSGNRYPKSSSRRFMGTAAPAFTDA
jgi:hypothetical protein